MGGLLRGLAKPRVLDHFNEWVAPERLLEKVKVKKNSKTVNK